MRRLAALVLVLLLAGCTRPEAPAAEPVAPAATGARDLAAAPSFLAPAVPDLAVELAIDERWVRPQDNVTARAVAHGSQFEWYLATRNPLATLADAGPFALAPGGSVTLDVRREGRHAFALDASDARVNVSIVPNAVALRLEVRLVDDGAGARFAPQELLAGRGSVLHVVDERGEPALLRRVEAMKPLGRGAEVAFAMPDVVEELGDYDLVVVARDGSGAVGSASARIIYDNRKPDPERTFGPFVGTFQLPPLGEPGRGAHAWESAHPLRALQVSVSTTSGGPVPGAVRVTLVDDDGAPLGSTEGDGFSLADLPAGGYGFVVEQLSGAFVEYRVDAHGIWELTPPDSFFRRD